MGKAIVIILMVACRSLFAATWYSSADGTETNGTYALPWPILYAVTNTNPQLAAGDTVIFKTGGTFSCLETNSSYKSGNVIIFRKAGTTANKITYRAETLWGFSFDGGVMLTVASNVVLQGVRVFSHYATNRTATNVNGVGGFIMPPGITEDTQGNELLHNLIENTGHPGIASWSPTCGKNIRGNVIRFAGFDDWIDSSGGNRGSGMYMQNDTNTALALIEGNVSYFNYTTGMKAYGNTDIWGFTFRRNVCVNNLEAGIFFHQDNYGSSNFVASSNYMWRNGTGMRLGYPLGNNGHSNAIVTWNYLVDDGSDGYPFYQADGWRNNSWSNNVGVALANRYLWLLEVSGEASGDTTSHHMGGNTYYSTNTGGIGAGPFQIEEVTKTLAEWKTETTTDADATHTYGPPTPTSLVSYVFKPSTNASIVHVAVFNWPGSSSTTVDLSSHFSIGTYLDLYDAQNIPTAYRRTQYDGNVVTLDLSLTNRAVMLGSFTNRTDTWTGFDSRIRAFVIASVEDSPRMNGKLRGIRLKGL